MVWFRSLISPLKKFWHRLHSSHRKRGGGLYILYKEVKSCPCEDVQVLWSILVESDPALHPPLPSNLNDDKDDEAFFSRNK